jgi:LPXTG-motif cell wall-anchored protein
VPPTIWLICVALVFGAFYLWAGVFPNTDDDTGGLVFFGGFALILIAAFIAKGYQKPEPPSGG